MHSLYAAAVAAYGKLGQDGGGGGEGQSRVVIWERYFIGKRGGGQTETGRESQRERERDKLKREK